MSFLNSKWVKIRYNGEKWKKKIFLGDMIYNLENLKYAWVYGTT